MIGCILAGDTSFQKIFMLVGPPRAGKGTIANLVEQLVGKEHTGRPRLADLERNFGLEPLIGKKVGIISDARLGGRVDTSAVLERLLNVSGEDGSQVDIKHKKAQTVKLPMSFLILTNELPRITDNSGALQSRFFPIQLTRSWVDKVDRELGAKLRTELSGVLNWALDGYDRLKQRGRFVLPKSSIETMDHLDALSSPIRAFLHDWRRGPDQAVEKAEAYRRWSTWCQTEHIPVTSNATFGRDLLSAVPALKSEYRRIDGKRVYVYVGIGAP